MFWLGRIAINRAITTFPKYYNITSFMSRGPPLARKQLASNS